MLVGHGCWSNGGYYSSIAIASMVYIFHPIVFHSIVPFQMIPIVAQYILLFFVVVFLCLAAVCCKVGLIWSALAVSAWKILAEIQDPGLKQLAESPISTVMESHAGST